MATVIDEKGNIVGVEIINAQFLHGTPQVGKFTVKVNMNGVNIQTLVKHALLDGVIQLRKRIKTLEQVRALAEGITFDAMVSASPKDANTVAATLDVNSLSPEVLASLMKKIESRLTSEE